LRLLAAAISTSAARNCAKQRHFPNAKHGDSPYAAQLVTVRDNNVTEPPGRHSRSSGWLWHAPVASAPGWGGPLFSVGMFALSHAWLLIVREVNVPLPGLLSYALQQAAVWSLFSWVDNRLLSRRRRFAWAAFASIYLSLILVDSGLMRMTSLPLHEILPMLLASEHVVEGMREIGLKPWRVLTLLLLLMAAAAMGGAVRLFLADLFAGVRRRRMRARWRNGWVVLLTLGFVLEQMSTRDGDDYLYRGYRMPLYLQLYSTSSRSIEIPIPGPIAHETRARWLEHVTAARKPRHVLYILLESFRADAIDPKVTPAIWELGQQGLMFDHALAEATYTPLSWSVLLFDEAAHDNLFGRNPGRPQPLGGWLFTLMQRAGMQPHLIVSTNLTYAKTRDRLLGRGVRLDYFQAAKDQGEDPADKNQNDRVAVEHTLELIRTQRWDAQPQFVLLQLDSTHYTYPFPEDQAIFRPYSESLTLPRPIETAVEAALLHNRYLNAAHFVDAQVARVLDALKRAGVYDDMLIVLTADHGEGLVPGLQGHGSVHEATKRVPLIWKLPGEAPRRVSRLISHRDILPTLTRQLGIDVPEATMRGKAFDLNADRPDSDGVLTLAPSGRYGQLTTADYVLDLRLVFKPTSVTVTPASAEPSATPGSTVTSQNPNWLPLLRAFLAGAPSSP
jgi:hypothetical protein